MKAMKSLVGLFLVIILGLGVYFFVYKPDQALKLRQEQERFLVRFDVSAIDNFTIGRPDSTIRIERAIGNLWNITQPITAETENEEILTLFNMLRTARVRYVADENTDNLGAYGLASPEYYLATHYTDGKADTLYLGSFTPEGSMGYVRFASENRVVAIDRDVIDHLHRPVQAFRSRSILNVFATDITAIEIMRNEDETLRFQYDGVTWRMTEPYMFPTDTNNIPELIASITGGSKKYLLTEHADDLAEYGLDNPGIILKVSQRNGMPEKLLLIGHEFHAENMSSTNWFAKQFDQDVIFSIDGTLVKDLTKKLIWYIDKYPMQFNRELANRIIITIGGTELTIIRDSQRAWSIVEPVDMNIEETTVSQIFSISRFMTATEVISYDPDETAIRNAGLDSPQMKIVFYHNDELIDWVEFGDTFVEADQTTFFRTSSRPVIYLTTQNVTETINTLLGKVFE